MGGELLKIVSGLIEQGDVTIDNPSIEVEINAGNDSIMVGSQTDGASGRYNEDISSAVAPSWGSVEAIGFQTQAIMFQNMGDEAVEISFDGVNIEINLSAHGNAGDAKTCDNRHETGFYVRSVTGSKVLHVEAW